MKLNLHILFDEMQQFSRKIIVDDDTSLVLQGIRFLSNDEDIWSSEYIYLVNAETLRQNKGVKSGINLLCLGEIDNEFLTEHGWKTIILPEVKEERKVFESVLEIFDKYEKWDRELTNAILCKEPLQTVFDIGARFLWNPIALFDISLIFIIKAGPLPNNILGTIWEDILEKGYTPIEVIPQKDRISLTEKIERNQKPFFFHYPKKYSNCTHIIAPLFRDEVLFGTFGMMDINKPFTLGQLSLVYHLKINMELAIRNSPEFANIHENTTYFADRILQGFAMEPQAVTYHLSKRGWTLKDDYCIFFFSRYEDKPLDGGLSKSYMFRIQEMFNDAMIFAYEHGIIAIGHGGANVYGMETFRCSLGELLDKINLRAGISMVFSNFMDLKYAYIQSKAALIEGARQVPQGYLFDFNAYYCDHVIHSLDDVASLKSLCHPKLLQLAINGGENVREYIRSLRLYLFNGRNTSTTAAMLFVHRNTLTYRLERIEKLLELDLDDLDEQEFFSLYLSCLITDYL